MKILHIATGYNLDFNGGITNYVRSIARQQAENNHDVYVLSDGGKSDGYEVVPFRSIINAWSFGGKKDKKSLKWVSAFLDKNNFDLIHIHMMLNIDQDLYKIMQGRKYVVSLHDYFYICPRIQMMSPTVESRCISANSEKCRTCFSILEKNLYVYRLSKKLIGAVKTYNFPIKSQKVFQKWFSRNKLLLEHAEMLFPVSNRVKEIYESSGIKNEYHVLHIGNITAENFDKISPHKISSKINLVLLSSISKVKGGNLFCNMIKRVSNPLLQFHFYGRSNDAEKKLLGESNIVDHGMYKQVDLPNILSEMDMGVMTPIWEDNGPQVVMEMLNNHLPVFATRMGGIPDFVNNKNGYLFNPYEPKEVDAAVEFLNNLNFDSISDMRRNIKRTLTPLEHYNGLMQYYDKIL